MAYMLRKRILTQVDLNDDTTWKVDLPDTGMITAFELRINCDRYANRDDLVTPHPLVSCVDRVEIIAESTQKILSVTGRQLDYLNYIDFKRPNARRHAEGANDDNILQLFLMGGRSLYDTEYGWDMAKLKNSFLNYTYDLSEGVAEYFKAHDHDINVYAWIWKGPGAPTFKGYFKTRQVLAYSTSDTDVLKTLKITPGLPLRRIIVQKLTQGTTLGGTFSEIELEVNNGEYSPVVITHPMTWLMQEVSEYGLHNIQSGRIYSDTAGQPCTLPNDFAYYENIQGAPYATGNTTLVVWGLISLPPRVYLDAAAGEAVYRASGWGYQGCLRIGFDHFADLSDVLLTRGMGSLNLILTEAAGSKVAAVVLQEVELY